MQFYCRWNSFEILGLRVKRGIWSRNPNVHGIYILPFTQELASWMEEIHQSENWEIFFPSRGNIYDTFLASNPLRTDGKGCAEWFSWNSENYFMIPCPGIQLHLNGNFSAVEIIWVGENTCLYRNGDRYSNTNANTKRKWNNTNTNTRRKWNTNTDIISWFLAPELHLNGNISALEWFVLCTMFVYKKDTKIQI